MLEPTRILIAEDLVADFELACRELRSVVPNAEFRRVETREDFVAALTEFQPELVITDFRMPAFDGLTALKLSLQHAPDTPVIILTGAINEDTAVECMKAGAADYVIKEHIKRLGSAVVRSLEEKQERLRRRAAEAALHESDERLRQLAESIRRCSCSISPRPVLASAT
jgi:DNA-binding NtrC family response regulator